MAKTNLQQNSVKYIIKFLGDLCPLATKLNLKEWELRQPAHILKLNILSEVTFCMSALKENYSSVLHTMKKCPFNMAKNSNQHIWFTVLLRDQGCLKVVVQQLFKKWKLVCHKAGHRSGRVSKGQWRVSEGGEHCHNTLQPAHTEGDGHQEIVIISLIVLSRLGELLY